MRYLDTFSGVGTASLAWQPLGWECVAHAENAAFPSAVLAHRFPEIPNWGDCLDHLEWPLEPVDLVCGGTPCQAFSVAGLRAGLADPRGNLTLTYLAIVDQYRPRWFIWENVYGVLGHNRGQTFAAILGALGQLGYGWSYRVLDTQYTRVDGFARALPQRRRRVYLVGHLGDWRYPAAVLFERESLRGHPAPRRQAQQSGGAEASGDPRYDSRGAFIPELANCLTRRMHKGINTTMDEGQTMIPVLAFSAKDYLNDVMEDVSPTLRSGNFDQSRQNGGVMPAIVDRNEWRVRRLLPVECERLQGLPDDWTNIPWRGKNGAPDSLRYKAVGNSWAVNVARWIGWRIAEVESLALALDTPEVRHG
jgi:DNA (cytosine-5)-methyltransferase 1